MLEEAPAPVEGAPAAESAPAPEPVTEPVPEPVTAETFGWDDWDGQNESLPEQARGWHERFDARSQKELQKAQDESRRHRMLYDSLFSGDEDPRIAESTEALTTLQREVAAERAATQETINAYEQHMELEGERYSSWLFQNYESELDAIQADPSSMAALEVLIEGGIDTHNALDMYRLGPGAMKGAAELAKQGVQEAVILRLMKAEHRTTAAPQAPPVRRSSPASQVVTGARPSQAPSPPPPRRISNMSAYDARIEVARRAIAKSRR